MTSKTRTITLTDARPVSIDEDEWPVIASSDWDDRDSQYEFEANRRAYATIRIRQHEDGRTIVYGTYRYRTTLQDEDDVRAAVGTLLAGGKNDYAVIASIRDAVDHLSSYDSLPEHWQPDWKMLADDAIADLPAEKL